MPETGLQKNWSVMGGRRGSGEVVEAEVEVQEMLWVEGRCRCTGRDKIGFDLRGGGVEGGGRDACAGHEGRK